MTNQQSNLDMLENSEFSNTTFHDKAHSWRICSIGKHYVKTHSLHIPPSKEHPEGQIVTRHEHCADNPSHKDELSYDEIQHISKTYFSSLEGPPTPAVLTKDFEKADRYDTEIRGWVRYWNDIFHLDDPLDPNLIKALIATESSFEEDPKRIHNAHGVMQIKNDTFSILQNTKGELTDFLIRIDKNQLLNPSANICMGVRWLFQKKKLASSRLQREASWEEAIIEYKGYWDVINSGKTPKGIDDLRKYYSILQEE